MRAKESLLSDSEEALIDRIYEAAAAPESWPRILGSLSEMCDGAGFLLLMRRNDSWVGYRASDDIEEACASYMESGIAPRSNATRRLIAREHAGFLSDTDLFSAEEWEREPLRRDWARAWGLNHALATAVQVPNGDFIVFNGMRLEGEPAFSAREKRVLDRLRPHLARSVLLAVRWRVQQLRSAAEALGRLGFPAAVVDGSGRVLAANAPMERQTTTVRWLAGGRMALTDPEAEARLNAALSTLHVTGPHRPSLSFAVRAAEGTLAVLHVIPAKGTARDIFGAEMAIVALTTVEVADAPPLPLLQALFDLSVGEARVAAQIAEGGTLDQLAHKTGVSKETVRSQLRQVLFKTGTKRQAEVAALLGGIGKHLPQPASPGEADDLHDQIG